MSTHVIFVDVSVTPLSFTMILLNQDTETGASKTNPRPKVHNERIKIA